MSKTQKKSKKGGQRRSGQRMRVNMPLVTTTGRPAIREVLAYHTVTVLTESAAGAGQFTTFRLNSIYDPDFSGIGSTALGYTTKAGFYGRYKVLRARYHVRFWGSTPSVHCEVGTLVGANTVLASNPNFWAVEPGSTVRFVYGNTGTAHSEVSLDKMVTLHKILGITREQYADDSAYGATFGTNPAYGAYLTLWMVGRGGVQATIGCDVRISYDVEFSSPLQTVTS